MTLDSHLASFLLLFALLNPFLMSIYLIDLITDLGTKVFLSVLTRGALISAASATDRPRPAPTAPRS